MKTHFMFFTLHADRQADMLNIHEMGGACSRYGG